MDNPKTIRFFDDIAIGDKLLGQACSVEQDEMIAYAKRNDPMPFHADPEQAAATIFGGLIASGGFALTLWYRSAYDVGQEIALLAGIDWNMRIPRPIRPGDVVTMHGIFVDKQPTSKPDRGVIAAETALVNQHGDPTLECNVKWLVATRAYSAASTGEA